MQSLCPSESFYISHKMCIQIARGILSHPGQDNIVLPHLGQNIIDLTHLGQNNIALQHIAFCVRKC